MDQTDFADDGASRGSFHRACERCKQSGVQVAFLWRAKQWQCAICIVNTCYDDAVKEVVALMQSGASPFGISVEEIRRLALKIQANQREQLEGAPTPARR